MLFPSFQLVCLWTIISLDSAVGLHIPLGYKTSYIIRFWKCILIIDIDWTNTFYHRNTFYHINMIFNERHEFWCILFALWGIPDIWKLIYISLASMMAHTWGRRMPWAQEFKINPCNIVRCELKKKKLFSLIGREGKPSLGLLTGKPIFFLLLYILPIY